MKRVAAVLITLALVVGMVGCPADPEPTPLVEYSLTISSSEGGEVTTPGEGVFVYSRGETVSLVTAPASGYYFGGWTGDVSTIANTRAASTTITMNGDYSITADFQVIPLAKYNLTVSSTEGGSVTAPGQGTFAYDAGTVVELVAEAEEGYQFTHWTGSVGSIGDVNAASTTVTMMGDYTITAKFAREIRTWHDLHAIRDNLSGYYVLVNDLDSNTSGYAELAGPTANGGKGWEPIGTGLLLDPRDAEEPYRLLAPFAGEFDGQRHEIRDLFINRPRDDGIGLFGYLEEGAVVANIGVVNTKVTGQVFVGGLVGVNTDGSVIDSYYDGSVTGTIWVGGLTGVNRRGVVINSHSRGSVTGRTWVGGLVGWNELSTIADSYSIGKATSDEHIGGLIGYNHGIVRNSYYSYDEVLLNGRNIITIGALFREDFEQWLANDKFLDVHERLSKEQGYYLINNVDDFKQLLAFGQDASLRFRLTEDLDLATEANFYIPYLAGEFHGHGHKVANLSFNFGFVSQVGLFGYLASGGQVSEVGVENVNITGYWDIGGLVGFTAWGTVTNCYSGGSVTGTNWVGGLVGTNEGTVRNSHSTASVTGDGPVGGLTGVNAGTVSNSYASGSVIGINGVGGLTGDNYGGTVRNSYATGLITRSQGTHIDFGGFLGRNWRGSIVGCYSTGSVRYEGVSDPTDKGFAGSVDTGGNYEMTDSFWDTQTSGQTSTAGHATGKTTTEMHSIATFLDVGWDIVAVDDPGDRDPAYTWNIVDGQTYPFLSWQSVS